MNKKKSKALAFLLAASLLVPSANGIVSAAELRGNDVVAVEQAEGTEDSSTDTGATVVATEVATVSELKQAINNNNVTIKLTGDITLNNNDVIDIESKKVTIVSDNNEYGLILESSNLIKVKKDGVLKLDHVNITLGDSGSVTGILCDEVGATVDMEYCKVDIGNNGQSRGNVIAGKNSKIILKHNEFDTHIRAIATAVGNGSEIEENIFDLGGERFEYKDGDKNVLERTGALSIVADENGSVSIINNTFKNANRAIGIDHSNMKGENLTVKGNKFIDTRYAFEVGSEEKNNKDKSYDLSDNYYNHKDLGGVGPLRIEDASASGKSHFEENGTSTELKIDDKTPLNIAVGPYYTTEDASGNLVGAVNNGVATVNGKDYPTLAKAIEAARSGQTVTIHKDVELISTIGINKKGLTIIGKDLGNGNKVSIKSPQEFFDISADDVKIENVKFIVTGESTGGRFIEYGDVKLAINECEFLMGEGVEYFRTIMYTGDSSKNPNKELIFTNNKIKVNCRSCMVGVYNNTKIKNNYIDMIDEHYKGAEGDRTGVISLTAKDAGGDVVIEENTFKNANRVLSLDHSTIDGDELIIKRNIFENVRFGAEIDPNKNNKDKKYDFSGNYFYHKEAGGVGPMKIQDASRDEDDAQGNPIYNKFSYRSDDGKSVEIKFDEYTDQNLSENINQWPYYTDSNLEHLSNEPGKPIKPVYDHTSIIGKDRYDTAAKIADKLGSYDTVVLVNATSTMSDGLSASGLAGKENGAILLTKKDSIPKVTMDRIKKVKKVYIIGGENAISAKVANEITAANIKVERIGGKNRVETSELVAKKLGNYKKAFVVNGFKGEADAMSASAVAAKNGAPILLTNGKTSTHAKKAGVEYYVIGGKNVVNKSIATKYNAEVLAGSDRYATNREVINEFYSGRDKVYIANGDKLVDALTASPLAKKDGIVLVNKKSDKSILKGKDTVQVGGMDFKINFK